MKILLLTLIVMSFLFGCKEEKKNKPVEQLNISFYLDLSDRIEPARNKLQAKKDIEIINQSFGIFSKRIEQKGTFDSKDKFKVFFYPFEKNENLIGFNKNLQFDFSSISIKEKKTLYAKMRNQLNSNLDSVYKYATSKNDFIGSDIYRFFKDELEYKCITKETNYRNILIVLTDGYMYWKYSIDSIGNRFSYLTANSNYVRKLRSTTDLAATITKEDYGFINIHRNYSNLEILVLEINPIEEYPQDFDLIKLLWSKWFIEMGVKKFDIIKSTDIATERNIIKNFIDGK